MLKNQQGLTLIKILLIFIVTLLILVIAGGIFLYVNLKPFLVDKDVAEFGAKENSNRGQAPIIDKNPLLNETQEKMLEKMGVDPAKLPTEVTPEMESCALEKISPERIEEIKSGSAPSALEIFKLKGCLE